MLINKNPTQEEQENAEEQEQAKGISWGMSDDAEEFPDMEQVPLLFTYIRYRYRYGTG
jgi:hypothetical protein